MGLKGWIAKVLSFTRVERNGAKVDDVKCDPGGGAINTLQHFPPLGDDSYPLETDYVAAVPVQRNGVKVALGYVDPINERVAEAGEKRTYARDADGAPVVENHLKNTGESVTFNENGTIVLNPDGSIKLFNNFGSVELKADGSAEITNTSGAKHQVNIDGSINSFNTLGFINLLPTGIVNINGATITPLGAMAVPISINCPIGTYASMIVGGKELKDHTHPAGTPPGDTGINNA